MEAQIRDGFLLISDENSQSDISKNNPTYLSRCISCP